MKHKPRGLCEGKETQQMQADLKEYYKEAVSTATGFVAIIRVSTSGLSAKAELLMVGPNGRGCVMTLSGSEVWKLRGYGTDRAYLLAEHVGRAYGVPLVDIVNKLQVRYV